MNKVKKRFFDLIDNIGCISSCLEFLKIRNVHEIKSVYRTIYVNNLKPDDYDGEDKPLEYATNQIKTSKYTLWNFLPKNLFEQFRRIANFYFLVNLIIIFVIPDPPYSPYTSMIPILFVVIVTAVKQAYEDILRHKSDREINNLPVRILKNGAFEQLKWKDIKCGDIVQVLADESFPCDLLLLYSKSENANCFVTTVNLDGETNLKLKTVPVGIPIAHSENDLENLRGVIQCEKPNAHLYEFKGKIRISNKEIPIINENILLRGSTLRVSPMVYGCAIYTGKDTKMMKNTKFKSNKLSCIERFILLFLVYLAIITFTCFGCSFIYINMYSTHWYLAERKPLYFDSNRDLYNFIVLILYTNLFNYIIPLSMYVTIELQRFVGSQFIEWDLKMYDDKTDQIAKANTSDLNEDLGQIEYLFSDKTGTLTENEMIFKQFSIDGIIYHEQNGEIYKLGTNSKHEIEKDEKILKFFQVLSFCHTVQVDESAKEKYQASSPDEFSFIKFCTKLGIVFLGDEKDKNHSTMVRVVNFKGQIQKFLILDILEFDSTRKRMSIILKNLKTNQIVLFCKGAESAMFKNCTSGNVQAADDDIKTFAENGWRTLALAFKNLSENDYKQIKDSIDAAKNDILNRDERLAKVFDEVESRMELLGATAVEDKLQDDVANTLESLRRAGIKVWVLTGDKKETAINISHSCKHFSKDMSKLIITDLSKPDDIKNRLDYFEKQVQAKPNYSYALIIDGLTLGYLFNSDLDNQFRKICMKCEAVLCCRMSPAQKASVVKLVKKSEKKPMTAAIGDGANDVSMIQEAHVGLGIFGKEGRNAARSADFAFAKFKYARRILLVHGYLYYTRGANLVQYFFYKNFAFAICQFYFSFFTAFSVTSVYDSLILTFYNIVYTSAPILLFGLFEQKVAIKKLENDPFFYRTIKKNRTLRTIELVKWNLLGTWHSIVSFFFVYGLYGGASFSYNGQMSGKVQFGVFIITSTILIVHFKLFLEWQYKTIILASGFGLSLLAYIIFSLIINSFIMPQFLSSITDDQSIYWVYYDMLSTGTVWLTLILNVVAALIPDLVIIVVENLRDTQKINKHKQREFSRLNKDIDTDNENESINNKNDKVVGNGGFEHVDKQPSNLDDNNNIQNRSYNVKVFVVPSGGRNKVSNTKVLEERLQMDTRKNDTSINHTNKNNDILQTNDFSLEEVQ